MSASVAVVPASVLRRVVAVVVDFLVIYVFVGVIAAFSYALSAPQFAGWGLVLYFVLIDLPLTAFLGQSVGRMVGHPGDQAGQWPGSR